MISQMDCIVTYLFGALSLEFQIQNCGHMRFLILSIISRFVCLWSFSLCCLCTMSYLFLSLVVSSSFSVSVQPSWLDQLILPSLMRRSSPVFMISIILKVGWFLDHTPTSSILPIPPQESTQP